MSGTLQWKARSLSAADKLLAAGAELFSSHGYSATTVESVALKAGVNKALVSYHFGGKRGLYLAVRGEILELLLKTTAGRPATGFSNGLEISLLLERLTLALVKRPLVARSVLRETLGDGPPPEDGITVLEQLTEQVAEIVLATVPGTGSDPRAVRQHSRSALVMLLDQASQGGDAASLKRTHSAIMTVLAVVPALPPGRRSAAAARSRPCLPGRPPGSLI